MPLVSDGPETEMLTPILGKKRKTCQFFGEYLGMKLHLAAELSAKSILAVQYARRATSGEAAK